MDAFANDPGDSYIPFMKLTPGYWQFKRNAFKAGDKLIAFYRRKIQAAKDKLASGKEPTDFVTCYLSEIESITNVDSKIKEDWTIQVSNVISHSNMLQLSTYLPC